VLGTAGCSVLTTESAVAAQAMLLQYDFDLLITDIVLGDSNGFALANGARGAARSAAPLYFAHEQGDVKLRRARAPLLAKPFRLHDWSRRSNACWSRKPCISPARCPAGTG